MPTLVLENLGKKFSDHVVASSVNMSIDDGEFISILGPSGCGKTTVLRMIAGLIEPSSGRILVGGKDITNLPPNARNIGMVFQSYALFPHMTVWENVAFGLRRKGVTGKDLGRKVDEALESVRLTGLGQRKPRELSGGQQQRVAIARSISPQPSILLFDEPLSNLDAALRDDMQIELRRIQREVGITTLFVTHDQTEAMSMSDRVCVMANGVVQQFASPEDIYHQPASSFVAGFIGRPNRVRCESTTTPDGARVVSLGRRTKIQFDQSESNSGNGVVDLIIRQEDIELSTDGGSLGGTNVVSAPATVSMRSFIGSKVQYLVDLEGAELLVTTPTNGPCAQLDVGASIFCGLKQDQIFLDDQRVVA